MSQLASWPQILLAYIPLKESGAVKQTAKGVLHSPPPLHEAKRCQSVICAYMKTTRVTSHVVEHDSDGFWTTPFGRPVEPGCIEDP